MDKIIKRLANLLSVKSIVTLVLTTVFAYLSVTEKVSQDFLVIYMSIVSFYFGTQTQKISDAIDNNTEDTK